MKLKILVFFLSFLPKKIAHKILYFLVKKRNLNYSNPVSLNEKIHWLIVNKYGKREALFSDKYLVKKEIEKMNIKDLNIPKTIYVIENKNDFNNISFSDLPKKFVIKCNHGSGHVFVCTNDDYSDFNKKMNILFRDLKKDFSKSTLEYHYHYIKPVIIIEEFLESNDGVLPNDYKFFSYKGCTKCVMVCTDRDTKYSCTFFDKNWNKLPYSTHESSNIVIPDNFDKMWEISEKLSSSFDFVRVDLYNINGSIYFGELTFTPAAGLSSTYTDDADVILGSYLNLN